MNAGLRFIVTLAILAVTPAFAAKPAGKPATMPSVRLRHLIDTAMAAITDITKPKKAFNRAPLTAAQAEFSATAQTAPPEKAPLYQAALNVLANLSGAIDEHEKAVAKYTYSKNLHGPQDTKDEDISNVRHGYANNAKQNKENSDSRKALLEKEQLFLNGATNAWAQRLGQIRDIVEQSYTAELVMERQLAMAATPAPILTPPPKAPKPRKQVAILTTPAPNSTSKAPPAPGQYSPVGIWAPEKTSFRTITVKEDNTTVSGKHNGTWKWADQSKGTLTVTWDDKLTTDLTFSIDGRTLIGKSSNGHSSNYTRGESAMATPPGSTPAAKPRKAPKQIAMAATPASAPASKAPSAPAPYSAVGAWTVQQKGFRSMTLKEDNTVSGGKYNGTWKWTDQSRGALTVNWSDGLVTDLIISTDGRAMAGKSSNGHNPNFTRGD